MRARHPPPADAHARAGEGATNTRAPIEVLCLWSKSAWIPANGITILERVG